MKNICYLILAVFILGNVQNAFAQESRVVPVLENILGFKRAKKSPKKTTEIEKGVWNYDSVMFDKKTNNWLDNAIRSNEQGIPIEILLPDVFPSARRQNIAREEKKEEEEKVEVDEVLPDVAPQIVDEIIEEDIPSQAPVFYLKSIMYLSPDSWSVWINDKKLTSRSSSDGNLHVINVNETSAAFLWEDSQIEYIYPNWLSDMDRLSDGRYVSNNKNVVVDTSTQNISFMLNPNQTMVSKSLEILEGRENSQPIDDAPSSDSSIDDIGEIDEIGKDDRGALASQMFNGHNPADGLVSMQKHTDNLKLLKSILEQNVNK